MWAEEIGLPIVPCLYEGPYEGWAQEPPQQSAVSTSSGPEGFVVRNVAEFSVVDFTKNVAKYVRKGHVQTDEHWTKSWKPNKLV